VLRLGAASQGFVAIGAPALDAPVEARSVQTYVPVPERSVDRSSQVAHATDVWWPVQAAGAGPEYLARIDRAGYLELLSVTDPTLPFARTDVVCGEILAWSSEADRERIICLDSSGSSPCPEAAMASSSESGLAVLRRFDLNRGERVLAAATLPGCYAADRLRVRPRSMSSAGGEGQFVFGSDDSFGVVFLDRQDTTWTRLLDGQDASGVAFAWSPSDARLLIQRGERLELEDESLPARATTGAVRVGKDFTALGVDMPRECSDELFRRHGVLPLNGPGLPLAPVEPCSASFLDAPERWCGRGTLANARWAPDALSIVFQTRSGALWVADVSVPGELPDVEPVGNAAACESCIEPGAFAIQP
jgi:hypothetical protein